MIALAGAIVMAGWFLDIAALKSILPVWVTMKFSAALAFVLSGIELYYIARFQKNDREVSIIVIPVVSMIILLLMTSLLASTFLGMNVGIEEMFVKEQSSAIRSVAPGMPSVATMINFVLIAMAGILKISNISMARKLFVMFGVLVALIGAVAVTGYAIAWPLLYFQITGVSTAMALHTAILFCLWGAGMFSAERNG